MKATVIHLLTSLPYSYQKNNTNEYLKIFVPKKLYERISEYFRIKKDTNYDTNIKRIFVLENI